jgi:hypothetical protein
MINPIPTTIQQPFKNDLISRNLPIFPGVGTTVEHASLRIDHDGLVTTHAAAALPFDVVSKAT